MPRCNSRGCEHCFPQNREEQNALSDVYEQISYEISKTPAVHTDTYYSNSIPYNLPRALYGHPDEFEPWFIALALAYDAGIRRAMEIVKESYVKYNGDPEDLK